MNADDADGRGGPGDGGVTRGEAAGDARLRRWAAGVDRARAAGACFGVIPLSVVEYIRDQAAKDLPGRTTAMPKEAFTALVMEAAASAPANVARAWRQSVADAEDSPRDLVLIPSATLTEIAALVMARRRVTSTRG